MGSFLVFHRQVLFGNSWFSFVGVGLFRSVHKKRFLYESVGRRFKPFAVSLARVSHFPSGNDILF